jgi:hypothetical protein
MNRKLLLGTSALALVGLFIRCTPPTMQDASLSLTAKPRTIANDGMAASVITITATDEMAAAGTGIVHLSSTAGSLSGGMDVTLDSNGSGTANFTCDLAMDMGCSGKVTVNGTWSHAMKMVTGSVIITVATADAGVDGGMDAGMDAGMMDAGANHLTVSLSRQGLVAGTGDQLDVSAKLVVNNMPVAGTQISFSTNGGSFAAQPGTATATAMTDTTGVATVPLYAAGSGPMLVTITATGMGLMGSATVKISSVTSITYQPDPRTKAVLGTASGGRETSTQVFFKVVDAAQQGVGGIGISYELTASSPVGASVSPQSVTDDGGVAYTTLTSGNGIGIAAIHAMVTATIDAGTTALIDTTHPGTPIVLGKPTDLGFSFDCPKRNLGALHHAGGVPPTRTVTEACNLSLADRNGNRVGLPTPVQFLVEVGGGTIQSSVMTDNMGKATVMYDTTSSALPRDVMPITGEPDLGGGKNPRDMTVTLVAVVAGAEEFWDGSGDGGILNGKWDPGEWFIDLPEPFVDENDNGVWDPGEPPPIDGPRLNCATGLIEPANGKWDGPNGCYDGDTQIFRVFHVQWTGPLDGPLKFTPSMPPLTIPAGASPVYTFYWSDVYGSPMSTDSPGIAVMQSGMNTGMVSIMTPGVGGDSMGFLVHYNVVEATETATGSGIFNVTGMCDSTKPSPGPLTRCMHQTVMDTFGAGNSGTLNFTGRMPGTSADGGVRAPGVGMVTMTATHSFSTPRVQTFEADYP